MRDHTTRAITRRGLTPINIDNEFIDSGVICQLLYYTSSMKLMAIDYGHKRVGLASTDESGEFAIPRAVWPNNKHLLERVLEFAKEGEIERIVIGESKNFDNAPNPIAERANKFKEELESHGVDVVLHPEIFTTVEARRLQGSNDMTDASAAALILKNYIEGQES